MLKGHKITVGVREAKAQLTKLIAQARRGAVVDITYRGKSVVQLTALRQQELSGAARLQALEEHGSITCRRTPVPRTLRAARPRRGQDLQTLLQRDREPR
ncbi:MAG: type II toxin-antitoxin system prevent-host-death family antitoxin [Deltaproteobacteria bacterium]|nr:type II toxin-antitoxin system prevent-host-death family antitoxin [Deltaproteobacteria bacterium]